MPIYLFLNILKGTVTAHTEVGFLNQESVRVLCVWTCQHTIAHDEEQKK